jgi:hypothetical protein
MAIIVKPASQTVVDFGSTEATFLCTMLWLFNILFNKEHDAYSFSRQQFMNGLESVERSHVWTDEISEIER